MVADQRKDRHVSIRVDGAHQDLSAFPLPRSELGGAWSRGTLMEQLLALVVPTADFAASTDDSVYWDNLSLRVSRMPFSP